MAVFNNVLAGAAGQGGAAYSIERSLRFNADDNAYLTRDPDTQGTRTTWTWSAWVKFSSADRKVLFAGVTNESNRFFILEHNSDYLDIYDYSLGTYNSRLITSRLFRDYSAWYHIVFTYDTTNSTADDRHRLYVNGEEITAFNTRVNPAANHSSHVLSLHPHYLSGYTSTGTLPHDGYMAEVYLIDGQSLQASDFGEYDSNNVWQPKEYEGTYGTHGWHLDFSDATNTTTIAEDSSGNGNDWTANNISVTAGSGNDSLFDSPQNGTQSDTGAGGEVSGNYCTLNPLAKTAGQDPTLTNGNLDFGAAINSNFTNSVGTIAVSSGKWYVEYTIGTNVGSSNGLGFINSESLASAGGSYGIGQASDGWLRTTSVVYNNSSSAVSSLTSISPGDVVMLALDIDNGKAWWGLNGTFENSGSPGTGASPMVTFTPGDKSFVIGISAYHSSVVASGSINFGQRSWDYSAPSGFSPLCTTLLPTPTIADGSDHFDAKIYTGNGSSQSITTAFSPDFVWIKRRSFSQSHQLVDTVRGYDKYLFSDVADDELTDTDRLTSFNSDGFTIGADSNVNTNGGTYVGWAWDGGSSTVSNTDGDITSSVRSNTSAGFSIVSYTGSTAVENYTTVGHGLNATPEVIIVKNRTYTSGISWRVYHASAGETKSAPLDTNGSFSGGYWNSTAPTSSVFSVTNNSVDVNNYIHDYIAYCWTSIEGYSKFSEFVGNGSADGTFVYTGFRPRWILIKRKDANANWRVLDTARRTYNPINKELYPSLSNAEATFTAVDALSNGFKLRTADSNYNFASNNYVYMAFAEHPFKTARAF